MPRLFGTRSRPRRPNVRPRCPLILEVLEGRTLLSTLTVLNLNDSGAGSLRQAILNARSGDTINFAVSGQITLTSGPLTIAQNLTIAGPGQNLLTISGNQTTRVLQVGAANLSISGVTIANGATSTSGAGILCNNYPGTTLSLTNCTFANNDALGNSNANGGAVEITGDGTMNVTGCSFLNNQSQGNGGAIDSPGVFLNVTNSTFAGNSCGYGGGAISIGFDSIQITNSTFDSNSADGEAGAIYSDYMADYTLTDCTIVRNQAPIGGGLRQIGGDFVLQNTIVAGNSASAGPDVAGSFESFGNNLIGITDDSTGWTESDRTGTGFDPLNAQVGALGNYGGPTLTDPLLEGSPALGAGSQFGTPGTDQRGDPRYGQYDIGAGQLLAGYVTSANDSGPGTLRQAILDTNAHGGDDYIYFNIPGSGVHTIALASALPEITDSVVIDGYTQSGASANTLAAADNAVIKIVVDGEGMVANGLVLNNVKNCEITGLSVVGFGSGSDVDVGGIEILGQPADQNVIAGDFVGVLPDGVTQFGNSDGIYVVGGAAGNIIGGTAPADRNVISGNDNWGFILEGNGNTIAGNLIGLAASGLSPVPNGNGGVIDEGADGNVIGGTTPAARNYIAGNYNRGLKLTIDHVDDSITDGPAAMNNLIEGNWIGLNINGMGVGRQNVAGIEVHDASGNRIGVPGAGNVISSNLGFGVEIVGANAVGNSLQGNFIGTGVSGNTGAGNLGGGVIIEQGAMGNTIGGTGAGNAISSNFGNGISIVGAGPANAIQGNLIGTNASGTAALGNLGDGILVTGGLATLIGGTSAGASNVISGNAGDGIVDQDSQNSLTIQGNIVGLNAAGTAALGNLGHGIQIVFAGNAVLIGGDVAAARNVISGNAQHGISLLGSNVTIAGNFIGTDVSGRLPIGNGASGIGLDQATRDFIGDISSGGGNVISGNSSSGIEFYDGSDDNIVVHNLIGVAANGVTPLGNGTWGVHFIAGDDGSSSFGNMIGSAAMNGGNVIAYSVYGVEVDGGSGDTISNNSIFGTSGRGIYLNGGNDSIAAPVLAAVGVNSVSGTVVGAPDAVYRVEFFSNSASAGPGQGQTFLGSVTFVTNDFGVGFFSAVTANIAPGLLVSATATNLTDALAGDTSQFSVYIAAPLPLARFRITQSVIKTTAGQMLSFTVSAVDGNGFILTGYQGTVAFSSAGSDTSPLLPANYTFTQADAGTHTFTARYFKAGAQTLTASDILNGASGSTTVVVSAAAFDHLFIDGLSATTPIGVEDAFTVEAVDLYGNVVTGFNSKIHFSSNDPFAQLPAETTITSGIGVFDVTFRGLLPTTTVNGETVRVYSVTVTDKDRPSITATQSVELPLYLLPAPVQFVAVENVAFTNQLVATFRSDLSNGESLNPADFTATIDWADGSTDDDGTIRLLPDGTTFAVYGNHQYPSGQTDYPIDVTISFAGFSSQPVTPSVAAVVTAEQFAQLGQRSVLRATGNQSSLSTSTYKADAVLTGASSGKKTTLFVADYNDNPQSGAAVSGVSYYDIRATNASDGAQLTVTFRFPEGSGIPELEYFDATRGEYVPVVGGSPSKPVVVAPGEESITITFDASTFPQLSSLQGSVFTIVLAPLPISESTNISPALALADRSSADLTVGREVSFQGSGLSLGLSPSQDATRAAGRAELSGGGDDPFEGIDPADIDAILNVLGFTPPTDGAPSAAAPVVAPAAAPPATPSASPSTVGPAASGPGAKLPPPLPVDTIFAEAAEAPFNFQRHRTRIEQVRAFSPERDVAPSLMAVPLVGALALQPPLQTANRRRRRVGAFQRI